MTTSETWETRTPDLLADVRLYNPEDGGRTQEARLGWGCPCFVSKDGSQGGWDARLQLGNEPLVPGSERRLGFVFLSPEGAEMMRRVGRFYLWEGGIIGEARVVGH